MSKRKRASAQDVSSDSDDNSDLEEMVAAGFVNVDERGGINDTVRLRLCGEQQ